MRRPVECLLGCAVITPSYSAVAVDPKILKREGAEDNLSVPSSFIANAHNGLYAFYTQKRRLFEKNKF